MKTDSVNAAILKALNGASEAGSTTGTASTDAASANSGTGFLDMLSAALEDVNTAQVNASESGTNLALGDESYLHNTMIAFEKANLALQLVLEVRSRLVEAYQEIMRMSL